MSRPVIVAFVALLLSFPAAALSTTAARPAWWWTPELANLALQAPSRHATVAACAGVGNSKFRLKKAMSVSPDGILGYGANWGEDAVQVPKYNRFRCLVWMPDGVRQGWLVVDLIPRGPGLNQLSLLPTPGFRTIDRPAEYR